MGKNVFLALIASSLLFFSQASQNAFAASATMNLSPQSGSFGKQFSVDLTIDGHGEKFNAAQSTVSLSYGLAIKDLVLDDCNFSFLKMPSAQEPSFVGIIPSTYSTKCTVYKLTLIPTAKTNATIALTKGQVRRYGDATNVLSTSSGGSYILTAALKAPETSISQSPASSKNGLYTVNINVLSGETPVNNATVMLNRVSDKKQRQTRSDRTGLARFLDLSTGIYDVMVIQNNTKVGETIINVNGPNHTLTFSINLKGQQNNPLIRNQEAVLGAVTSSPYLFAGILVAGIGLGGGISFLFFRFKKLQERKHAADV